MIYQILNGFRVTRVYAEMAVYLESCHSTKASLETGFSEKASAASLLAQARNVVIAFITGLRNLVTNYTIRSLGNAPRLYQASSRGSQKSSLTMLFQFCKLVFSIR